MLERERLQPRYRGLAHTVGPREIGLRSAFRESLDSLLPLVAGQSRRAPRTHATGLGTDTVVAGTSNDQCALELSKAAQNGSIIGPISPPRFRIYATTGVLEFREVRLSKRNVHGVSGDERSTN